MGMLPIVLSGCSGAGKSSLLALLADRGYAVRHEVGRSVVKEQMASGGTALPWVDAAGFVDAAVGCAVEQYDAALAEPHSPVLVDRSVIDLVSFLEYKDMPISGHLRAMVARCRYHPVVFTTPPWRTIYADDGERQKSFDEAVGEYEILKRWYLAEGYELRDVPYASLDARADFVEETLKFQTRIRQQMRPNEIG